MANVNAFESGLKKLSRPVAADYSAKQYYLMSLNSSGQWVLASTEGQRVFGILQDDPGTAGRDARNLQSLPEQGRGRALHRLFRGDVGDLQNSLCRHGQAPGGLSRPTHGRRRFEGRLSRLRSSGGSRRCSIEV